MLDHQRIIDDLRNAMYSATPESLDMLRLAVADYAVLCDEANERLRTCDALLRQGLRSEAIQACEIEPNLLDLVSTLDFADREQLVGICATNNLAIPANLSMDVAAELNEAYAVQQPLEALLRHHRLLAIAQGSLTERIKTLRSISELDQNSSVWLDDLKTFEKERLKEIHREAEQAARAGNLAVLDGLVREVKETPWHLPTPAELARSVKQVADKVRVKKARMDLGRLEPELNDAFAAFDVEAGHRLREKWQACVSVCGLRPDDPLAERVAPALAWLDEQDAVAAQETDHAVNLAALERTLDTGRVTATELERLYHLTVRHGHELPQTLETRYKSMLQGLEFGARRRATLIITSIVAAALLVAGTLGAFAWSYHRAGELKRRADGLAQLIADGRLGEAERYFQDVSSNVPWIAHSAEVQALDAQLKELLAQEQARKEEFEHAMKLFESAGLDDPDHAALTRAGELAKTDADKTRVAESKSQLAKVQRERQATRDKNFLTDLDVLANELKQVELEFEKPGSEANAELLQRIAQNEVELNSLVKRGELVTPAVRDQAKPLRTRVATLKQITQQHEQEQATLKHLAGAIGDPGRYAEALREYGKRFPDSSRAAAFQRVVDEIPLWEGIARWNDFAVVLHEANQGAMAPEVAKQLVDQGNKLVSELGKYPQAVAVRPNLTQLTFVAARAGDDRPIHEGLKTLFKDRLINKVWVVKDIDGKHRWYTDQARPETLKDSMQINFIAGFDFSHKNKLLYAKEIAAYDIAPQSIVADKALAELAKFDNPVADESWERHFATILRAIYNEHDMEPILKIALLKRVVPVACQGSEAMNKALAKYRAALENSSVNTVAPWMLPEADKETQAVVRQSRDRARAEIAELADMPKAAEEAAKLHPKIPRVEEYEWVGVLTMDRKGRPTCLLASGDHGEGELFVTEQVTADSPVAIEHVGHFNDGHANLDSAKPSLLLEGRPVLMRKAIRPKPRSAAGADPAT